jgi:serine/threonine-protein kinase
MMLNPGQDVSHFRIIRKLGEGGMGEVYLAEDTKLHRQVALKILQAEFLSSEDRLNRFRREAQMAAQVNNSNVMAIYEFDSARLDDTEQETTYIVSEYVDGRPLMDYLKQRQPDLGELLRLAQRISSGLAAAHELNIVHRDIKSENILVDENGEPKILDFGLAKPIEPIIKTDQADSTNTISQELTQEGKILGTISYMSPEQARGEKVDTRSDIFAFGILVYKMFTGVSPFEGKDRVSVLAKILEGRATPLREYNEAAPAELQRIIDKCLQKDARDRYQNTRDLVLDIRTLRRQFDSGMSESVTTVSTESPAFRGDIHVKTFGWKKLLLGMGAIAAVMMIIVVSIVMMTGDDTGDMFANLSDDPDQLAQELTAQVAQSLREAGIEIEGGALKIPGLAVHTEGLAIFGFTNKTGDENLDWLSAGLPEILLTDLSQGTDLHLISRRRVLDHLNAETIGSLGAMPSHAACVDAALALGATRVLTGSYFKLGENIRIDARIEDARSGRIILAEKVVGADPFQLVDSLTNKIAVSLDAAKALAGDQEVAEITSSSAEAYKHYILGMEQYDQSRFDAAREEFVQAIEIDTNFALSYMRIGMSYALTGTTQGIPYFQQALTYRDQLPQKHQDMLDIWADLWIRIQFDDAMTKMETYVADYPDDKEMRAFYAICKNQLYQDREGALAQLDTVMMLDPKYYWGLGFLSAVYQSMEQYDKAIEYNRLQTMYHPQSLSPYTDLAALYLGQGRLDEAAHECRRLLEIEPGHSTGLTLLFTISILQRDFDKADEYIEERLRYHGDDPYQQILYHRNKANIANWHGQFGQVASHYHQALSIALDLKDSIQVSGRSQSLSDLYLRLGQNDSCLYYGKQAWDWASRFEFFNYPLSMVLVDLDNCSEARSLFQQAADNFKSRVPEQLWSLANQIQNVFEGFCRVDTTLIIDAYRKMVESQMSGTEDIAILGKMLVLTGQFEEGRETLQRLLSGEDETANGYRYLSSLYYRSRADEELGDIDSAKAGYEEVIRWWNDASPIPEELEQAREHLAALAS